MSETNETRVAGEVDDDPIVLAERAAEAHKLKPADEHKMVLVVRNDLGMTKGKIGAQCGHATLGAYRQAMRTAPEAVATWYRWGATKVCLKVQSEEEFCGLMQHASMLDVCTFLVHDAGNTQIPAGSLTVLAIGPAPLATINEITGHLKLL